MSFISRFVISLNFSLFFSRTLDKKVSFTKRLPLPIEIDEISLAILGILQAQSKS